MNVNIAVGARFNAGITANALVRNGIDLSVYTSSPSKNWKAAMKHVHFVPMPFRVLASLAGMRISGSLKEKDAIMFDRMVALLMRESNILHGWASFSLASDIRRMRRNQMVQAVLALTRRGLRSSEQTTVCQSCKREL